MEKKKLQTFSNIIIHSQFERLSSAHHTNCVPLVVIEFLPSIKGLRSFAWGTGASKVDVWARSSAVKSLPCWECLWNHSMWWYRDKLHWKIPQGYLIFFTYCFAISVQTMRGGLNFLLFISPEPMNSTKLHYSTEGSWRLYSCEGNLNGVRWGRDGQFLLQKWLFKFLLWSYTTDCFQRTSLLTRPSITEFRAIPR